jgi:hypothetical protein
MWHLLTLRLNYVKSGNICRELPLRFIWLEEGEFEKFNRACGRNFPPKFWVLNKVFYILYMPATEKQLWQPKRWLDTTNIKAGASRNKGTQIGHQRTYHAEIPDTLITSRPRDYALGCWSCYLLHVVSSLLILLSSNARGHRQGTSALTRMYIKLLSSAGPLRLRIKQIVHTECLRSSWPEGQKAAQTLRTRFRIPLEAKMFV